MRADHFLERTRAKMQKEITGMTPAALEMLEGYAWPGNVRELENAIKRGLGLAPGEKLPPEDFCFLHQAPAPADPGAPVQDEARAAPDEGGREPYRPTLARGGRAPARTPLPSSPVVPSGMPGAKREQWCLTMGRLNMKPPVLGQTPRRAR